ncbi:hypothetical protein D3C85_635860 [compost metagenome]
MSFCSVPGPASPGALRFVPRPPAPPPHGLPAHFPRLPQYLLLPLRGVHVEGVADLPLDLFITPLRHLGIALQPVFGAQGVEHRRVQGAFQMCRSGAAIETVGDVRPPPGLGPDQVFGVGAPLVRTSRAQPSGSETGHFTVIVPCPHGKPLV